MDRPWMKLHTRDWLDNKELRRCSPTSRATLVDLMCLAHEGYPYGHLADKLGPLSEEYMAARCFVQLPVFLESLSELKQAERVHVTESGILYIKRMVDDEDLRLRRSAGGSASIGHPNTNPPRVPLYVGIKGSGDSRARMRADSDSSLVLSKIPSEPYKIMLGKVQAMFREKWGEEFEEWAERQYARHPKKKDKQIFQQVAVEKIVDERLNPILFEERHKAWCASEDWKWKGGAKVPTLAQWILDDGWLYDPPRPEAEAAEKKLDSDKYNEFGFPRTMM
jgi:hypothetical protein